MHYSKFIYTAIIIFILLFNTCIQAQNKDVDVKMNQIDSTVVF